MIAAEYYKTLYWGCCLRDENNFILDGVVLQHFTNNTIGKFTCNVHPDFASEDLDILLVEEVKPKGGRHKKTRLYKGHVPKSLTPPPAALLGDKNRRRKKTNVNFFICKLFEPALRYQNLWVTSKVEFFYWTPSLNSEHSFFFITPTILTKEPLRLMKNTTLAQVLLNGKNFLVEMLLTRKLPEMVEPARGG